MCKTTTTSFLVVVALFLFTYTSSTAQENKTTIAKSTLTSVGLSIVKIKKHLITQSIGDLGVIGTKKQEQFFFQEGFLTSLLYSEERNEIDKDNLLVYPNPFVDSFDVKLKDHANLINEKISIRIIDFLGNIVFEQQLVLFSNKMQIQPTNLKGFGVYILQVSTKDYSSVKKIIKIE